MTTVKELIEKLQEVENKDQSVYVWEEHKAHNITSKFLIKTIKGSATSSPFILLEGETE